MSLVSHLTTSTALLRKPPAMASSSAPPLEITDELMNQPMGSLPITMAIGQRFSPRSIFFMNIFQPVWPSSGFTPS